MGGGRVAVGQRRGRVRFGPMPQDKIDKKVFHDFMCNVVLHILGYPKQCKALGKSLAKPIENRTPVLRTT